MRHTTAHAAQLEARLVGRKKRPEKKATKRQSKAAIDTAATRTTHARQRKPAAALVFRELSEKHYFGKQSTIEAVQTRI